jgi:hypothetical protein
LVPDDVTIDVVELSAPLLPDESAAIGPTSFFYLAHTDGREVWLERMTDLEGKLGDESVFEDRAGNCYVCAAVFQKRHAH